MSESELLERAGKRSYELGQKYFRDGRVGQLSLAGKVIRAVVEGSESYRVRLEVRDGKLGFSCDCYYAADDNFCKHCVAVGLAWRAKAHQADASSPSLHAVRAYLEELPPRQVVDLLIDAALGDEKVWRSLLANATRGNDSAGDPARLRELIDEATDVDEFIAWNDVAEALEPVHEALDAVEALLAPSTAAVLMDVLEYGIGRVEGMLEDLDDSIPEALPVTRSRAWASCTSGPAPWPCWTRRRWPSACSRWKRTSSLGYGASIRSAIETSLAPPG